MKRDWISVIAIAVIILCGIAGMFIVFEARYQECTSDPFVYGARQMEENYDAKFFGSGNFMHPNSPIIYFDSEKVTIEYNR